LKNASSQQNWSVKNCLSEKRKSWIFFRIEGRSQGLFEIFPFDYIKLRSEKSGFNFIKSVSLVKKSQVDHTSK